MWYQIKMESAVIKSGAHVKLEKLESISGLGFPFLQQRLSVNTITRRKVNSLSLSVLM